MNQFNEPTEGKLHVGTSNVTVWSDSGVIKVATCELPDNATEIVRRWNAFLALEQLILRCRAGVSVEVNEHRNFYQTAEVYLKEKADRNGTKKSSLPLANPEVLARMIELDAVVEVQFYPLTPVGFYKVYHWDLGEALKESLALLEEPG